MAPMGYSRLVFATIIGFVIFLELSVATTLVGAELICLTSFYTVRVEQRRRGIDAGWPTRIDLLVQRKTIFSIQIYNFFCFASN